MKRLAFLLLATFAAAEEAPKITEPLAVDGGRIDGGEDSPMGGVKCWKGIPFAAPPVGELRWKAPQPVKPWPGVLTCSDFGPACPQAKSSLVLPPQIADQGEDCLRLNVWTPAKKTSDRFPVFVLVHGSCGGFSRGSAGEAIYEGELLSKRGVVVVTFEYRLGVFGWLAHRALAKESGSSGNYGLLDQVAALEWVKRNIATFGGDPGNVTLAGRSGGAACVAALMVCPKAKGLFHKAVLQGAGPRWIRNRDGEAQGQAFSDSLSCGKTKTLEVLRSRSVDELVKAAHDAEGQFGEGDHWGPWIDGELIPDDPWRLWRDGKEADVPLLAGGNADDGSMFALPKDVVDVWQYKDWLKTAFPADPAGIAAAFAPRLRDDVPQAVRDLYAGSAALEPARFAAACRASRGGKAYVYIFSRVSPGAEKRHIGAYHGGEIAYTLGSMVGPVGHDQVDHALAHKVCDAWAEFAKTGDPNGAGNPWWPAYDPKKDEWLEIKDDLHVVKEVRKAQLDALAAARVKEEEKK